MTDGSKRETVLVTGATGYVGSRLVKRLEKREINVRCLARNPDRVETRSTTTDVVRGDVLDVESLDAALDNISTAYYMIHLMASSANFEEEDRIAASNFAEAANRRNVQRIVYLGGLGDDTDPGLSKHLRSRHEVGDVLRDKFRGQVIEFRASVVIGQGSLSFDLIQSLTNRLPVMICPRWLSTPTQPIAINDVLAYLEAALDLPPGESVIYEIGSNDVATYGQLIQEYARQRGLKRWLISVPLLTPYLSSLWLGLVTPAKAEVGRQLIEGLRNPTIVRDQRALKDFEIRPVGLSEAIRDALADKA